MHAIIKISMKEFLVAIVTTGIPIFNKILIRLALGK